MDTNIGTGMVVSQELVEPFAIAAHGDLERVQELYAANPEVLNVPWARFDETGLAAASHMGNCPIAEFLLSVGAPLTVCAAAMLGRVDDVERFVDADPSLANARGAHGIPIMYHAAMSGDTGLADLLLARGGGEGMNAALHGAITHGRTNMVRWLLDHGVTDLNAPDFEGKTPLQSATDRGETEIADMLRERGALSG